MATKATEMSGNDDTQRRGLSATDRERIVNALDTHIATLKRAMNGKDSQDPELKAIRDKRHAEYNILRNRIASGELDL